MTKLRAIKRSRVRSEGGVWWNFETGEQLKEPHAKDLCVLVAEAGNPKYREALSRLRMLSFGEIRSGNGKAGEILERINDEAAASAIVLGWANLEDDEGKPILYSSATALELLRDPDAWQFRQFVFDVATIGRAYQKEAEDKALGN